MIGDGADRDQVPAGPRPHGRDQVMQEPIGRAHVQVEHPFGDVERLDTDRGEIKGTGVQHHDVRHPQPGDDPGEEGVDR